MTDNENFRQTISGFDFSLYFTDLQLKGHDIKPVKGRILKISHLLECFSVYKNNLLLDILSGGPFRKCYRKSCITIISGAIMSKIITKLLEVHYISYCYPTVSG